MKKFSAMILAIMMTLSLVACGETQSSSVDEPTVKKQTEFEISSGVYKCGTDFAAGAYVVSIVDESEYWIDYIVFDSVDEYISYQNSGAFTTEEEVLAIEQNAHSYTDITEEELGYLEIKEGNVLKFDGDGCLLTPASFDDGMLYNGAYLVGENLKAGAYRVTNKDYWGTEIEIFESKDVYKSYFSTHRFTVGDENEALEKFLKTYIYIDDDENNVITVEDGQILIIDGTVSFEVF